MGRPPEDLQQSLRDMGLLEAGQTVSGEQLTGGVASDIWRVEAGGITVCVKRALEQLKVSQQWRVPTDRNAYEVAWFEVVAGIAPQAVPRILGHDPVAGVFVMEYFPAQYYPVWKAQLRDGVVVQETIVALAEVLVQIHAATAGDPQIADRFSTDELFYSLRLEPYFYATAQSHPELASQLAGLAEMVGDNKRALVHGDFSPKNILVGERGPIILDAECAWYGDPAFDLAFCLNHLLLKGIWNPPARAALAEGASLLYESYLKQVSWEPPAELAARAAAILPGLMLARIDGKSPAEYIVEESDKVQVREFARRFLLQRTCSPQEIVTAWAQTGSLATAG